MKNLFKNLIKSKSASGLIFCLLILAVMNIACAFGEKRVDKEIVGVWQHQEMLGDPRTGSMVIVSRMQLNEDGTAYFADGNGDVTQGKWYVNYSGLYFIYDNGNEVFVGSYETNGRSLLINGSDGKKLWERLA